MTTGTAQQMFVGGGGARARAARRSTRPARRPASRSPRCPQGDRDDARAAIDAARGQRPTAGRADRVRARGQDARRRRHHRGAPRRSRAHADARPGQADEGRGLRRGRRAGRVLADGGRGRQAARRRAAELVLARQAGAAGPPRARRGRRDQPLELALHDARRARRPRAGDAATRSSGRRRRRRRVCAVALAECIADADLPPGRVQPRHRARARWSATRSPATRGPTGSRSSARRPPAGSSAQAAAGKATLLEMGGNGPVVVLDDGDVDAAVEATLTACFLCAGQSCTAGERILVHREVYDQYVEGLARAVTERIVLGDPFDERTTMGPLNNEPVAIKMDEHVGDAVERGASVGHRRRARRAASRPISTGSRRSCPASRRTRGCPPRRRSVRSRRSSRSTRSSDAIELTNESPYGLLAAIFTADIARGLRVRRQRADRLGQHQRVEQLLGEPSPVRRRAREPTAGSAGSAART